MSVLAPTLPHETLFQAHSNTLLPQQPLYTVPAAMAACPLDRSQGMDSPPASKKRFIGFRSLLKPVKRSKEKVTTAVHPQSSAGVTARQTGMPALPYSDKKNGFGGQKDGLRSRQRHSQNLDISSLPATMCPVARAVLQDPQIFQVCGAPSQPQAMNQPKYGVYRLPRGSLSPEKLVFLDHALASIALQRVLVDVEQGARDARQNGPQDTTSSSQRRSTEAKLVQRLGLHPVIASVPVLAKGSSRPSTTKSAVANGRSFYTNTGHSDDTSDSGCDDFVSSDSHRSTDAKSDEHDQETTATSINAAHDVVKSLLARSPLKLRHNDAICHDGDAEERRNLLASTDGRSSSMSCSLAQEQIKPVKRNGASSSSPHKRILGLARGHSIKANVNTSASPTRSSMDRYTAPAATATATGLSVPASPQAAQRRSSEAARRYSLYALNSLGGHAPQREFIAQVAK